MPRLRRGGTNKNYRNMLYVGPVTEHPEDGRPANRTATVGYDHLWEKRRILYGGLVELIVNAMTDVQPGFSGLSRRVDRPAVYGWFAACSNYQPASALLALASALAKDGAVEEAAIDGQHQGFGNRSGGVQRLAQEEAGQQSHRTSGRKPKVFLSVRRKRSPRATFLVSVKQNRHKQTLMA